MSKSMVYTVNNGEISVSARIIREGWDHSQCLVHVRPGADKNGHIVLTGQMMDVSGDDAFHRLMVSDSFDNGITFSPFSPLGAFASVCENGIRTVACDMTPLYHKKTGRFLVLGHTAKYRIGSVRPVEPKERHRVTPYSVTDDSGQFGQVRTVRMPSKDKYLDCGSGCSQCFEEENGDLLIPVSFRELVNGESQNARAAVMRCSFDGNELTVLSVGRDIEVPDEVRGIGEASVASLHGKYFLTIRGDNYGYIAESIDGLDYSEPKKWCFDDGEIVPTYNTQSHFICFDSCIYLAYTRKNGKNDHVFRHRAPLYAARFDPEHLCLVRSTEVILVPERGARLGNFGVTDIGNNTCLLTAAEWMQPVGCEKYGSNNALWGSFITLL